MRKTKTIKIDSKEITVKELRVKDIRLILESGQRLETDFSQMPEILKMVTDLPFEELEEFAPSELKIIWEAFREVNSDFLDLVARSGITEVLKNSILKDLTDSFAALSKEDTLMPQNTASASSL